AAAQRAAADTLFAQTEAVPDAPAAAVAAPATAPTIEPCLDADTQTPVETPAQPPAATGTATGSGAATATAAETGTATDLGTATGTATGSATLTNTGTGTTAGSATVTGAGTAGDAGVATATGAGAAAAPGWGPDMGAPATFVLLRHGETALTPQKRFSGSGGSDPELSPTGHRQAAAVAEALAARGTVQAVVSSPLRRCRETARAVADRLGLTVTVEEGLREVDFGAWEGLTFAEVRERFPDDLQAWLDSPRAAPTGGGESFATATRRISATRDRLLAAHAGRTVLLVTHVTPVKILVRLALGAPPESLFRMELSAASLSAVAYYADGNASVRLLNDTAHLR
ncbi:bifunctional RNase H/acid phosphatase, partial [Streptomyces sp. NPDC058655]|uniref:bifunctional RNase H/acid phosphatase n=1 Tax=Streptomyces sp. NPDC058655 TaxID=3346577 RepID=UPI00364B6F54